VKRNVNAQRYFSVTQQMFSACYRAAVYRHQLPSFPGSLDETLQVRSHRRQAGHFSEPFSGQFNSDLIGYLSDVGCAGTREDHDISTRTAAVLRQFILLFGIILKGLNSGRRRIGPDRQNPDLTTFGAEGDQEVRYEGEPNS
jgi:hypothetical protein